MMAFLVSWQYCPSKVCPLTPYLSLSFLLRHPGSLCLFLPGTQRSWFSIALSSCRAIALCQAACTVLWRSNKVHLVSHNSKSLIHFHFIMNYLMLHRVLVVFSEIKHTSWSPSGIVRSEWFLPHFEMVSAPESKQSCKAVEFLMTPNVIDRLHHKSLKW